LRPSQDELEDPPFLGYGGKSHDSTPFGELGYRLVAHLVAKPMRHAQRSPEGRPIASPVRNFPLTIKADKRIIKQKISENLRQDHKDHEGGIE
jgi:hypothetical protein